MWGTLVQLVVAAAIGVVAAWLLLEAVERAAYRARIGGALQLERMRRAVYLLFAVLGLKLVEQGMPERFATFGHLLSLLLIGCVTWVAVGLVSAGFRVLERRYDIQKRDNLGERKMVTQLRVVERLADVVIIFIGICAALMTFDAVRQIGGSLLASAGIAGIIAGFAAQRSLATLFAGLQIAFTQPIRVDDVVIVEGEWGRIEEITLTYVVVRIWDLRRLVVPITYFIEKPFQNWTRVSADLLGTVFLYTDYEVSVDGIRRELDRLLEESTLWDGKVKVVQVTDARERTMEVRVLVSAADSPSLWDLRVHLREKLLDYLRRENPQGLPRLRASLSGALLREDRQNMEPARQS
ncbi:MAG: mechanosensitive ion channel domain-containing protein [Pseudomonadota bacterium]|nr:mechanosensitive ion channel domain-containing protein [Pseudomonadota bacterium]